MKRSLDSKIVVEYEDLNTVTTMKDLLGIIEEFDCILFKDREILGPEINIPIQIHSLN